MKRLIFLLLAASSTAFAQSGEFTLHANGLIYTEATMNRLKVIVDSLNVRFRSCDLSHPYYSFFQGNAVWVEVTADTREQISKGITLAEFEKRYPQAIKDKQLWVTKNYYANYDGEPMIAYASLPGKGKRPEIRMKRKPATDKTSGWIMNADESAALYLEGLQQTELPYDYARLVQYVDCMIDTTATVMVPQAKRDIDQEITPGPKAAEFIAWANRYPDEPKRKKLEAQADPKAEYKAYSLAHQQWDSLRLLNLDRKMKKDHYHKSLLAEAVQESITNQNSTAELESYVIRYGSKADALALKRTRHVVGYCSMDSGPRKHAMNICLLAAETAQWDIFLRSHLNVMNDRFARMSDANYAWAGRKTYLHELEALSIPAVDLLLGTSLRVTNVSDNHYWGAINRTGRALADAQDKDVLEKQMLTMMLDDKLDIYNRLLIALVFDNYAHNLEKSPHKDVALQNLESTVSVMPVEIQKVWRKGK